MPFPTTGILDNFNRANEGPPPSASWDATNTNIKVISNEVGGNGGNGDGWWGADFGEVDLEAFFTCSVLQDGWTIWIACPSPGDQNGYLVDCYTDNDIYRIDSGVDTLLSADPDPISQGDKVGIEKIGNVLTVYRDTGSGWSAVNTATDSTHKGNYIGCGLWHANSRLDDFGGGQVVVATTALRTRTLTGAGI